MNIKRDIYILVNESGKISYNERIHVSRGAIAIEIGYEEFFNYVEKNNVPIYFIGNDGEIIEKELK